MFMQNTIKQSEPFLYKIWYNDKYFVIARGDLFYLIVKNACFNYNEVDLEDDLAGVPHRKYLSGKFIKTLLKRL